MKKEVVKIGEVGVDSGQLMICDPCYIESEFQTPDSGSYDHAHEVYRHKEDGSLWQYTYKNNPVFSKGKRVAVSQGGINAFPGSYEDVIPQYGKSPNQLRKEGLLELAEDVDPTPHIKKGEFSYRGICKTTINSKTGAGQLNYKLGHEGVAVAFRSGLGDGVYDVYAEIVDTGDWGKRISKVFVVMLSDEELQEMEYIQENQ